MLGREEPLPAEKRPHSAYRETFHTAGTTVWIDPAGKRVEFPTAAAVVLTTDRQGQRLAERGIGFDVYRADVNGDGSGMLFLSRDGILHGYTEMVEPFLVERVADLPEYAEQAKRFGIDPNSLKNHVRCVALSEGRSRYLVTIVDEAWCYDLATNRPLWGLRFPTKEGWTAIASERSGKAGASARRSGRFETDGIGASLKPGGDHPPVPGSRHAMASRSKSQGSAGYTEVSGAGRGHGAAHRN